MSAQAQSIPADPIRLLVVDDHPLFCEGLSLLLETLAENVEIESAIDFEEALAAVEGPNMYDLLLLDLRLPGLSLPSGLVELREQAPEIPVVVVSAVEDRDTVLQAFRHGAVGFIPKSSTSEVMLNALRLVLAGGKYVPPLVTDDAPNAGYGEPRLLSDEAVPDMRARLTGRQRDVLKLVGEGKSNRAIASALGLAEGTIKIHVTAILRTLRVANRTQAAMIVARIGVSPGFQNDTEGAIC